MNVVKIWKDAFVCRYFVFISCVCRYFVFISCFWNDFLCSFA